MSNQGYYDHSHGHGSTQSNNPYAASGDQNTQLYQQYQQPQQGFSAPSGPPPGQAPQRTGTDLVPESERAEQREAMEQFEMSHSGTESQTDKDVAQLQREFPGVDGSLIAAIYSDSGMGAAREILGELASQSEGK